MSTTVSIVDKAAANAILKKLEEAKQFIEMSQTEYETLHTQMDSLRQEKKFLTETVVSLKTQVEELQEQLWAGPTLREVPQEIPTPVDRFDADSQDDTTSWWEATDHHETQQNTAVIQTFDDVPDAMSVSTISTSSTRSPHKKNRKNKWHRESPKKWRRMMRSHRLQSILLTSN
jgi:predicted nuclease with TOPRIM domain